MNKTVTINLGGIIFHIEEDAYETLSSYLSAIKGYFKNSDGRDEIMADIENRIAEMLNVKVSKGKQAVLMSDVTEVIAVMGKPEEFAGESSFEEKKHENPSREAPGYKRKRIFRDADNRILGGVCSGLGHYFGFDPLWLRLAWVLLIFLAGTGFLLYIILWIIIPKAKTVAEKLEMQGEPVTAESIGKKIEEEMEEVKKKVNEFSEKAKYFNAKPQADKIKNFFQKLGDGLLQLLMMTITMVGKLVGIVLLIAGTILAIVFAAMFFGKKTILSITPEGVHSFSWNSITEMIFGSSELSLLATIGLMVVLGIPVIGILFAGVKLLFGIKGRSRGVGAILTAFWFGGVIAMGIAVLLLASEFSEKETYQKQFSLLQPSGNKLYLKVTNREKPFLGKHSSFNFFLSVKEDTALVGHVKLEVLPSESDSFYLRINSISRGETSKEALDLAENINYGFGQEDSLLKFNPYYSLSHQKWRNQHVKVALHVPVGKSVYFDPSMEQIIYDIKNTTNTLDDDMVEKSWIMTKDGLECVDCN